MSEPSPKFIAQLVRFGDVTGAIIPTVQMSSDEMQELAELLERWSSGEREVRQVILDKFAVELDDDMVL